jgi:hypothetical protein
LTTPGLTYERLEPGWQWYGKTVTVYSKDRRPLIPEIPPVNTARKNVVRHYAWAGYPATIFSKLTPTMMVGS